METVQIGDVTLGEGRVKVIVPLTAGTEAELVAEAAALSGHELDLVEWRVDHLDVAPDPEAVVAAGRRLVDALGGRPLLVTFRTDAEGGERAIDPDDYAALYTAVIEAGLADAVDVELAFDEASGDAVIAAARAAGVRVVGSAHDFHATPPADEIVARLVAMAERGCDVAKMAVTPIDAGDVLRLFEATWTMTREHEMPVITMAMGGQGVVSRLAGQAFGSCATFGTVGRASAPGQLPVDELQPILRLLDEHLSARAAR